MKNQNCQDELQSLLNLMFDKGETVCSSPTVYATPSKNQSEVSTDDAFLCINPISGFRRVADVTAFRSFLIEIDPKNWDQVEEHQRTQLLEYQKAYVKNSDLPYSASIFSGNKSFHFLIVLSEPFRAHEEYKLHFQWLANVLTEVDAQAGNAIVGVRVPGHVRHETEKLQRLDTIKNRVTREEFLAFLQRHPEARPRERKVSPSIERRTPDYPVFVPREGEYGRLSHRTSFFLQAGAQQGEWHREFTLAVKDLKAQNYTIEEAEVLLTDIDGFLDENSVKQLRYGYESFDWEMSFRPFENACDSSKGGES
ncbi:MAG: hypothetical protein ABTQ25_05390 [Nitrosomonas ureae]